MNKDRYIFSQIADLLPRRAFDTCVQKYAGYKRIKNFSCHDQFLALIFGQLTQFEKTVLHSLISNTELHFEENKLQMSLDLAKK